MLGQQGKVSPRDSLEFLDTYLIGSLEEGSRRIELARAREALPVKRSSCSTHCE